MKNTFNYTGRQRITRDRVNIVVDRSDEAPTYDASLDLSGMDLDGDGRVFVEAYYRNYFMRFPHGKVSHLENLNGRELSDFESAGGLSFRVRVVDQSTDTGRILALADHIQPAEITGEDEDGGKPVKPILPVNWRSDMGNEIWRLNIDPRPCLEANRKVSDRKDWLLQDFRVIGSIFPEVIRRVLIHLMLIDDQIDISTLSRLAGWQRQWGQFAISYSSADPPRYDHDEGAYRSSIEVMEWIDGVAASFCRDKKVLRRLQEQLSE